jgi:hypothetical protein
MTASRNPRMIAVTPIRLGEGRDPDLHSAQSYPQAELVMVARILWLMCSVLGGGE